MKGIHRVKRKLASGKRVEYHYAWRGGPRFWDSRSGIEKGSPEYSAAYRRAADHDFKRHGDPKNWVPEQAARARLRSLLYRVRNRAKTNYWECDLDVFFLLELLAKQGNACAISGLPFDWSEPDGKRSPYGPSIDRIDADGGYTRDNVRLVLTQVNAGLGEWGATSFLKIARATARKWPKGG